MNVSEGFKFDNYNYNSLFVARLSFHCLLNREQGADCNLNVSSCQMSNKLFKALQKTDVFLAQSLIYYPGTKAKIENPL